MAKTEAVQVGGRTIGPGASCYLIAEVGTTALGDMEKARELIHAAASAGMDAVKFQLIDPEQLSDKTVQYSFEADGDRYSESMYDMFMRLRFSRDEWRSLAEEAAKAGIAFFATVDFIDGVDLLEDIDVPAFKVGAWDATYRQLLERLGATGRPLFADLGPATEEEIENMVEWYLAAGGTSILFMHDYHTSVPEEMNLRAIKWVEARWPWPAGFSSPNREDDVDFLALALGAHHLEKRLILSTREKAFHSHESLEPTELTSWVERIRKAERALGEAAISPSRADLEQRALYYRSVCTLEPIEAGAEYSSHNLGAKRPGTGIPPARLPEIWGTRATRDLQANELLTESDVHEASRRV